MRSVFVRRMALVLLLASIGGSASAQETRKPAADSTDDVLLAEVRSLRAELRQVAGASIRMQLLVARLQLQEQRVLMAGRQLAEVQNALARNRAEIAGEQARVEQLEKSLSRSTAQGQPAIQQAILTAKAQVEQQQRRQQELQTREAELLNALSGEQNRWIDFNERLDALERSLPAAASH